MIDTVTGDVLVASGEEIEEDRVRAIENAGIETVKIRSVLTCESLYGVCVKATAAICRGARW